MMFELKNNNKIPKSWELSILTKISAINPTVDLSHFDDETLISFVPMPRVEVLTGKLDPTNLEKVGKIKKGYTRFQDGDVLFAKITPCMENGKTALAVGLHGGVGAGSTELHVLRPYSGIHNKYLLYFLLQAAFRHDAQHHMSGAVGQKRVPLKYLEDSQISVPPSKEQERIVDKIEQLFSDLDEGEALLKTVQKQLKTYRQSVLQAAVTGELTKEWREQNKHRLESGEDLLKRILQFRRDIGKIKTLEPINEFKQCPKSWALLPMDHIGKWSGGGTPSKANKSFWQGGDILWVSPKDMKIDRISNSVDKITNDAVNNSSAIMISAGSLLMVTRSGILRHSFPVAVAEIDLTINQDLKALSPVELINSYYLYFIMSAFQQQILHICSKDGTTVQSIEFDRLKRFYIPIPSLLEQEEIVSALSDVFSKIDALKDWCATELTRSSTLRQAILKSAFSGKLVPQDPSDEPASELLKRIQTERDVQPKPKAKIRKKKKAEVA